MAISVDTQHYLNKILPSRGFGKEPQSIKASLQRFHFNHPQVLKTTFLAITILATLGAGCAVAAVSLIGIKASLILSSTLLLITLGTRILAIMADRLLPAHFNPSKHVHKEGSMPGGSLRYQGDLPVLTITTQDPFESGIVQGKLLGNSIRELHGRYDELRKWARRFDSAQALQEKIDAVKKEIPEAYLKEMEGVIEGYKQFCIENPSKKPKLPLNLDEIVLLHLLPDALHFSLKKNKDQSQAHQIAPGCTAIIDQDDKGDILFGRTLDWPSLGISAQATVLIERTLPSGKKIAELTLSGITGTLTGMNSEGLSVGMLVCRGKTDKVKGLPALLFNRYCLENCNNTKQLENLINEGPLNPLGAYHLIAADAQDGLVLHFEQGRKKEANHLHRYLNEGEPLLCTNRRYDSLEGVNLNDSARREVNLGRYYHDALTLIQKPDRKALLEKALALPIVNNTQTIHTVFFNAKERTMEIGFDNGFSSKQKRHTFKLT